MIKRRFTYFALVALVTITFSCKSDDDGTQIIRTLPTDGLLAYYPFNANVNDESGNEFNGTINGSGVTSTDDRHGVANAAYDFSGGDVILPVFGENLTSFTVSTWFYDTGNNDSHRTLLAKGYGASLTDFNIRKDSSTEEIVVLSSTGTPLNSCSSTHIPTSNIWTHLALKVNNTRWSIYINGQLVSECTFDSGISLTDEPIYIGSEDAGDLFQGKLDDIAFYNRALTDNEIQSLASL